MSEPISPMFNLIQTVGEAPLVKRLGTTFSNTASAFDKAIESNPQNRFAALIVATSMVAAGVFGANFVLSRMPIHFIRKCLLPAVDLSFKAGLAWVVFRAADASLKPSCITAEEPGDGGGGDSSFNYNGKL